MLGQYLIVVLVCISLTIKDAEHLFLYLFVHLYIFFGQNVYSDPLSIFNYMMMMIWLFWLLSCMNFLYIVDINSLSDT